jgi:hypothetical protein
MPRAFPIPDSHAVYFRIGEIGRALGTRQVDYPRTHSSGIICSEPCAVNATLGFPSLNKAMTADPFFENPGRGLRQFAFCKIIEQRPATALIANFVENRGKSKPGARRVGKGVF